MVHVASPCSLRRCRAPRSSHMVPVATGCNTVRDSIDPNIFNIVGPGVQRGADPPRTDRVQELVLDRRHKVELKIVLTRTEIRSVCNGNGSYYTRFCSILVTSCNRKAIFQGFKMHFPVTLLHCNGI